MTGRIVIVDDDPSTLQVLAQVLASEGLAVEVFTTAEDALVRLRAGGVDLLLTDVVLPRMNGIELVTEAKQIHARLRCFVMSGHERMAAAASDVPWVSKPIDIDELLVALAA